MPRTRDDVRIPAPHAVSLKRGGHVAKKHAKAMLLSGGNPRIAMAEGAAPVKAYIAAMQRPGDRFRRDGCFSGREPLIPDGHSRRIFQAALC